ncbi:MAG TPA: FkbM family methyltransferase [Dehalococcoidia bacterium]|nr:FkbM family methyltransferase [Dehalococcoidia bacterium]
MSFKHQLASFVLSRALCQPDRPGENQHDPEFYTSHVPFGPLRGMRLSMRGFERPSFALGTYERHVVALLRRFVRPGFVAYDVGSHIGYLTLVLSRLVGDSGHVYSFEPDPANLSALSRNVRINGISNVTLVGRAVTDRETSLRFAAFRYSLVNHIAGKNEPADASLITVPATSLDHFVYEENGDVPAVIKLDVEGAEADVLRGARRLLAEARPILIAEVRAGEIWREIADLLRENGYSAHLSASEQRRMERDGIADVLLTPEPAKGE